VTQSLYESSPTDTQPAATAAELLTRCDAILAKLAEEDVAELLTAGGIVARSEPGYNRLILRKRILGS